MATKRTPDSEELDPASLAKLVNDRYGSNTIRMASDPHFAITRIPTGVLSVDYLLNGGFPRGRHVEIYGSYAVGKTYLTYRTIGSAQALGLNCAFIDAESTFDPEFASNAGVDLDTLMICEQESGQRVFNTIETLLRGGEYGVIGLDSIASLVPQSEQERDMEQTSMGTAQAKMMSEALRRLTAANRKKTVLIYINQLRDNVGVMFGKKDITSGGRAMSFYASDRLELSRTEVLKHKRQIIDPKTGDPREKDVAYGHRVVVRMEKDKTGAGPNNSTVPFVFDYELGGIDHTEDLIYLGRATNLITKSGQKWSILGEGDGGHALTVTGRAKLYELLAEDEDMQQRLEEAIWIARNEQAED